MEHPNGDKMGRVHQDVTVNKEVILFHRMDNQNGVDNNMDRVNGVAEVQQSRNMLQQMQIMPVEEDQGSNTRPA